VTRHFLFPLAYNPKKMNAVHFEEVFFPAIFNSIPDAQSPPVNRSEFPSGGRPDLPALCTISVTTDGIK
jgi:hypothetical protein